MRGETGGQGGSDACLPHYFYSHPCPPTRQALLTVSAAEENTAGLASVPDTSSLFMRSSLSAVVTVLPSLRPRRQP